MKWFFNLQKELKKRNISLARLSRLTGIRYEILRRSFNATRELRADELVRILTCTGIRYNEIAGGEENER